MAQTFHNHIGGRWVPARSGRTFADSNPANGEVLGEFPASGPEDLNDAVTAAVGAYPAWRLTPAPRRAEIVFRAGEIIRARKEDLARAMTREMGKVLAEAARRRAGGHRHRLPTRRARAGGCSATRRPSELPDKWAMSRARSRSAWRASSRPGTSRWPSRPGRSCPRWCAGNTVGLQAGDATRRQLACATWFEVLEEAGLPPGVRRTWSPAAAPQVGDPLVADPRRAGRSPSPARPRWAADRRSAPAALGKRVRAGDGRQERDDRDGRRGPRPGDRGHPVGRLRHHRPALHRLQPRAGRTSASHDELVAAAGGAAPAQLRLGDGLDPATRGRAAGQRAAAVERVASYVEIGQRGGRDAGGGRRAGDRGGAGAAATSSSPRCSPASSPTTRVAQEEIFGPVLSIVKVTDFAEARAGQQRLELRPLVVHLHARREPRLRARCATSTRGSST